MKKHYVRMAILVGALILVAFILGGFFFTYVQIQNINDEYIDKCAQNSRAQVLWDEKNGYDLEISIKQTYSQAWRSAVIYTGTDIGFSGEYFWDDGERMTIPSSDFIWVYSKDNDRVDYNQFRIILVGDDFEGDPDSRELWDIELRGLSDNVFVTEGLIDYRINSEEEVKTYKIRRSSVDLGFGEIDVAEWSHDKLYGEYIRMAKTKGEAALNKEAKEILSRFKKSQENGESMKMSKEGWFSSYYISYFTSDMNITVPLGLYGVYVFHPFSIVMAENAHVYILFAVVLLILEAMVAIVARKMYQERKKYELRSQQLTRSIAHDLKTPLAVTKAYVENWEYIDENDRPETAENINSEVDHMTKMVNTLLDLSNLDAGNRELKMEEVELYSLSRTVFRRMEPLAQERHLDVQFETDKEDGEYLVEGDLELLKIAIGNFLSNAVKYGEKKIRIRLSESGKNILFSVTNDGTPIGKKEIKKIWDPFYKTDKARTGRLGSSGVGLAVNKSILEQHKAKYGCRSDESGTTFWFEMRKAEEDGQ
ncbi:MAG: HAMP domain-containing histidine kinase [Clostridiales bacterium]|nr:HAMP domain-containing histidine kinase [Clostridiales bacterium]